MNGTQKMPANAQMKIYYVPKAMMVCTMVVHKYIHHGLSYGSGIAQCMQTHTDTQTQQNGKNFQLFSDVRPYTFEPTLPA